MCGIFKKILAVYNAYVTLQAYPFTLYMFYLLKWTKQPVKEIMYIEVWPQKECEN